MKLPSLIAAAFAALALTGRAVTPSKPVLFVTQVPVPNEMRPQNQAQALQSLLAFWAANHPFEQWQTQKFGVNAGNAAIAGPNVDFDNDGQNNLYEFAFNTDPNTVNPVPFSAVNAINPGDGKNVSHDLLPPSQSARRSDVSRRVLDRSRDVVRRCRACRHRRTGR